MQIMSNSKMYVAEVQTQEWDQYNLPKEIVSTNTVASFKAKLDKYWDSTGHGYEQRLTA